MAAARRRRRGPGRAAGRGAGPRRARGRRGRGRRPRACSTRSPTRCRGRRRRPQPAATPAGRPRRSRTGSRTGSGAATEPRARPARSWCGSRCGSRPTRRSWSPARCGWCCRSTTSRTRCTSATPRCCGPATPAEHGFGDRARTHAAIALRGAAEAWPVLDRLLELRVPDQITLDGDELEQPARRRASRRSPRRGVDVLWPRSLGRDLTATTVLDRHPADVRARGASSAPASSARASCSASAGSSRSHGDPLTEEEMDQLAAVAAPLLRLRGNWTVIDPADRPQGPQAAWSARSSRPRRSPRR